MEPQFPVATAKDVISQKHLIKQAIKIPKFKSKDQNKVQVPDGGEVSQCSYRKASSAVGSVESMGSQLADNLAKDLLPSPVRPVVHSQPVEVVRTLSSQLPCLPIPSFQSAGKVQPAEFLGKVQLPLL